MCFYRWAITSRTTGRDLQEFISAGSQGRVGSMQSGHDGATPHQHGPPPDGLECLATMEDITLEDKNYGKELPLVDLEVNGLIFFRKE